MQVRIPDRRAWLGPVHVGPTELTVDVRGEDCHRLTLEYFSPSHRTRIPVAAPGHMSVPLPDGLGASNTWVWLTQGTEWRDYRALSGPWATDEQLAEAGVEREFTSRDLQASVEAIVYGGEGPAVEFKSKLPETTQSTDRMFNTVAAFANGNGGTIVIGVDRNELTVVGIGDNADPKQERDRVGQLIRARVLPTPDLQILHHIVDGKPLLFVEVGAGAAAPYGVITHLNHKDTPDFVRRGASTYRAQPSDLNEIVQRLVSAARTRGNIASSLW